MTHQDRVILVNQHDQPVGTSDKLSAHRFGLRHRAISVMLMRTAGGQRQMLLQQRAHGKYHSAGLWANACCSHPRPDEPAHLAAQRRLGEELGLHHVQLEHKGAFHYRSACSNQMIEDEWDHCFVGEYSEDHAPFNTDEVRSTRWINWHDLLEDLEASPSRYVPWFPMLVAHMQATDPVQFPEHVGAHNQAALAPA